MYKSLTAALALLLAGTSAGTAAELRTGEVYLIERFEGLTLQFEVESWPDDALGVTMSIDPPASVNIKNRDVPNILLEFGNEVPRVSLGKIADDLPDGMYQYEISVGTKTEVKRDEKVDNGRSRDRGYDLLSYTVSGSFVVDGKRIVVFEQDDEKGAEETVPGPKVDDTDSGEGPPPKKAILNGREVNDADKG